MKKVIKKYKKSELDLFLQERIRENKEELSRNLEATLQDEQNCLEEIVKGIKHCKSNIEKCNKALEKASISNMAIWNAKKELSKIILLFGTPWDLFKWQVSK